MHRYYRYLNSLSRMTVLPKGGNQMNVLGESRVFLLLLAPNSLARINVFDRIWEEIIRASWSALRGCLHAPFIMKMIEVVTQTHFENQSNTPATYPTGLIPPTQLLVRSGLPQGLEALPPLLSHLPSLPIIHLPLAPPLPRVPLLAADLPCHVVVVVVEVVAEGCVLAWSMGLRHFSLCAETFLLMYMSWQGVSGRLTTIFVVKLPLWVCPLPLARLTCLSILLPRRSMSGTSRPTGCHLCQQTTKKKKNPTLMIVSSLPRLPTMGIRVNHPLTLRLPTRVRDPFLVTLGHPALVTITTLHLLLIIVQLRHLFFLRLMSHLGTPHSRKT
jgi:hypothetical protein